MSTNKKNTTPATNNSIIDVVVNGMTATEAVENVQSRLEAVEKSVFNIALISAYGYGITIPAYTDNKGESHAEAIIDDPMKQKDFITLVGRSSKTISRWCTAMELIIENGYFTDFSTGKYPFSYDKIIAIFKEENKPIFKGMLLPDLMLLSANTLNDMVKKYKKPADTKKEETSKEETDTDTPTDTKNDKEVVPSEVEIATLSYNGKNYNVPKVAFEKWLAENMIAE